MIAPHSLEQTITRTVREEWGRMLASLTKTLHDLELAEDCLQDAVEVALSKWTDQGIPSSPSAWLLTTARRKAIDRLRRDSNFASKEQQISHLIEMTSTSEQEPNLDAIPDKRLELLFTCCHPSLAEKTKVALTLNTVGGLTVEEIASAFIEKKTTMAQRLVRAKKKIKLAGIPYEIPALDLLPERLRDVLNVIYLIFNEGYSSSSGDALTKVDLSNEAIRVARILEQLLPDETEVSGLLALMLLHDSRRYARQDEAGQMIALEYQNRQKWDKAKFREGKTLLTNTLKKQKIGPYQLQASISALHNDSPSWEKTDWQQISALYQLLYQLQPSPVVRLNQAMAVSYADSIESALKLLDEISEHKNIKQYQPYYVARADLARRAGDVKQASVYLNQAIELTDNEIEKEFLIKKIS